MIQVYCTSHNVHGEIKTQTNQTDQLRRTHFDGGQLPNGARSERQGATESEELEEQRTGTE
jgi:hypothetical protein